MSTKEAVLTLKDDKQQLQKQLGCMNGLFQIFDRRYLLGQRRHRHGQNQKRLLPGQSDKDEKELKNESEKAKEKTPEVVTKEKKRVSVELPRNSFSSSSSSTAVSSLDCSKRVQTEQFSSSQSVISEPAPSPFLPRKQPELFMQSPDIRDVVKECMIREPRGVSIKKGVKEERVGPTMKYVDSPRPIPHLKPVQYDRIDRNLREIQWGVDNVKEISRFSCDGRESRYQLKSNMKVKELPRLSLDSRQGYLSNSANDPVNNKRPSSSVVARLMGLETLTASTDENQTSKTISEESVSNSKSSRKEVEIKNDRSSVSTRVRKEPAPPLRGIRVSHVITKISLETAPWKQEGGRRGQQKPSFKGKEGPAKTESASPSIYGEIEKRLTDHEFKTTGKDLRALKQILEAMQKTKKRLENKEQDLDNCSIDDRQSQKSDQQVSPTINVISPRKVKHTDARKESAGRRRLKEPTLRDKKSTGRLLPTSNFPDYSTTASPKMQRSKNSIHGPSSDLSRPKKQPSMQRTRNPKVKSMDTQDSSETRNLSQFSDTVSFQSESYSLASQNDSEVTSSEWVQELTSPYRPKENQKNIVAKRFNDEKSVVDHAKHTMEQPSPVSVLDAFYTEDTPSPVKKKTITFNDDENLHSEEVQDQAMVNNLGSSTNLDQYAEFNSVKLESIKNLVHQIELLNTNTDDANVNNTATSPYEDKAGEHRYIEEILLASGCLKDLDRTTTIVQLQPTGGLINPELFHVLEKTKGCTDHGYHKKNMRSKLRRKLVFDTVNDVLGHKLAMVGPFGPHKGRVLNGDKLLKELCSGIDSLQNNSERGIYDEDDEVLNIMNADVNKRSQDWEEYCYQVPGLVLDIERLIFKDLISEVVNGQVTSLQDWQVRPHCRQLFPM